MAYLLDTNVISDFRKGARCHPGVARFFADADDAALYLPVQVIGEIRAGIAKLVRAGETGRAALFERWLEELLMEYAGRVLDFDADSAQLWGTLLRGDKRDPHTVDKQIAAIAISRGLTLVTRDSGGGFAAIPGGVLAILNPFEQGKA